MKKNEIVHGFTVTRVRKVPEQEGTLYELYHEKSGASLCWLDREEENKTFCIGFRTVPDNDTGVFHILEHSVLCGSRRYPVKEPFVELMKSSLQTFLNAMTYPDRTVYPFSSRNQQDFENLMRIYMDAVLHPAIYDHPEIFRQEGWHFEPQENGGCQRNGVVLNEMRGAYSSVDTLMTAEIKRALFPDTCYQYESGGAPEHITELTYEQFLSYHRRFYHPSNARIFLDGSMPVEHILKILDEEFLCEYETFRADGSVPEEIPLQKETVSSEVKVYYPAAPGEEREGMTHIAYARILGGYEEKEKLLAWELLTDYLAGDNDAPLTRAILAKGLALSVEAMVYSGIRQPALILEVRNTDQDKRERIEQTMEQVFSDIAGNGIDKERMTALLNNMEFHVKEQNYGGMPAGVGLALNVMASWNFGGDPAQNLESQTAFELLKKAMDQGYFETLIRETLLNGTPKVIVTMLPDEMYGQRHAAEEVEEVAGILAAMSEAEQEDIQRQYEGLCAYQSQEDGEEALKTIPLLKLSDIGDKPKEIPSQVEEDGRILYHALSTRGIQYLTLYFPISDLTAEELPCVSLLCSMLGDLPTERFTAEEFKKKTMAELGHLSTSLTFYQDQKEAGRCRAYVVASCSVLEDKTERAVEYIGEMLMHTRFDDQGRIREIVEQGTEGMRQSFIGAGHNLAIKLSGAGVSASGVVADSIGGMTFYRQLQRLRGQFDQEGPALAGQMEQLAGRIFVKNSLIVSITGKRDEELAHKLLELFPAGADKPEYLNIPPRGIASRGVEIPSDVSYAVKNVHLSRFGESLGGAQKVLSHLLSLDYLWQKVRVQGGAYGTGMQFTTNGNVIFYSYRDPNPANSLQAYDGCGAYVADALEAEEDLTGIILGAVAANDPLLTPAVSGSYADEMYFSGLSYEDKCRERREMLSATPEKLRELCGLLEKIGGCKNICVVGSGEKLAECGIEERETL